MKHPISIAALFLSTFLCAQKPVSVKTTIKEVTIYEQSAQVNRIGSAQLPKGNCHIQFTDLPAHLNKDQIQFTASGDLTIQSMYFTYRNDTLNKEDLKPTFDLKLLEGDIAKNQKLLLEIDGRIAIYKREEQLLQQNSDFKSKEDGVDIDRLEKAATLLRERYLELHSTLLSLENEKNKLSEEINGWQLQRGKVQRVEIERWLELHVVAIVTKAGKAEFRVSYQTNNAGWSPFYDARVNNISEPIQLDYQAKVFQNSNEDWKDVTLTLSTGKPQQNYSKPNLNPWILGAAPVRHAAPVRTQAPQRSSSPNDWLQQQAYNSRVKEVSGQIIDVITGEALPFVNVTVHGSNTGTTSDFDGRYRIAVPANARMLQFNFIGYQPLTFNISAPVMNVYLQESSQNLETFEINAKSVQRIAATRLSVPLMDRDNPRSFKKSRAGRGARTAPRADNTYAAIRAAYSPTNVRFTAELPYSIPSNGQEYVVHLSDHELKVNYEYACAPKVDTRAYLTARIVEWEELDLLEGTANVYFEGTFVGQTLVDPSFADDTLAISLGIDEAVRVERVRVKSGMKKQFLSGTRKDSREWRIEVRNNKTVPIKLTIEDQIPVSNAEDIVVELNKDSGARLMKDEGILVWKLDIKSSTKRDLNFKYTVERPRHRSLILE